MKGYDQKPHHHQIYLDYHRFLFSKYHKQIVQDASRYKMQSRSNNPDQKIISLKQKVVKENSSGMNFSLMQSEIAHKSYEMSSVKESYFENTRMRMDQEVELTGLKESKQRTDKKDQSVLNSSQLSMSKHSKNKFYQGEPILKNLDDSLYDSQFQPKSIKSQINKKNPQVQEQKPSIQESDKDSSKKSAELNSDKGMISGTNSLNSSSLQTLKDDVFIDQKSEKKSEKMNLNLGQPSMQKFIPSMTGGQRSDQKFKNLSQQTGVKNLAVNLSIENNTITQKNVINAAQQKKESSSDYSYELDDSREIMEIKNWAKIEDNKKEVDIKAKFQQTQSPADSQDQDFQTKLQKSYSQNKNLSNSQFNSLHPPQSKEISKHQQLPGQEESFHTVKHDKTISSAGNKDKTIESKVQQKISDKNHLDHSQQQSFTKEIQSQKSQGKILETQPNNEDSQFKQNFSFDQMMERSRTIPAQKYEASDSSQGSFQQDHSDQSYQERIPTYEKSISEQQKVYNTPEVHPKTQKTSVQLRINPSKEPSQIKLQNQALLESLIKPQTKQKTSIKKQNKQKVQESSDESWSQSSENNEEQAVVYNSFKKAQTDKKKQPQFSNDHQKPKEYEKIPSKIESNLVVKEKKKEQSQEEQQEKEQRQEEADEKFSQKNALGDFEIPQLQVKPQKQTGFNDAKDERKQNSNQGKQKEKSEDQNSSEDQYEKGSNKSVEKRTNRATVAHEEKHTIAETYLEEIQKVQKPVSFQKGAVSIGETSKQNFEGENVVLNGTKAQKESQILPPRQNLPPENEIEQSKKQVNGKQWLEKPSVQMMRHQAIKGLSEEQKILKFSRQISNQLQKSLRQSLSQSLSQNLRKDFGQELKSQKELFYYELKDNLLEEISQKFNQLKSQLIRYRKNEREIAGFRREQVIEVTGEECDIDENKQTDNNEQTDNNRQMDSREDLSKREKINQQQQEQLDDKCKTCNRNRINKQGVQEKEYNYSVDATHLLKQNLKQTLRRQLIQQITPLVKQITPLIQDQIRSIFRSELGSILREEIRLGLRQQLKQVIKQEISQTNHRNHIHPESITIEQPVENQHKISSAQFQQNQQSSNAVKRSILNESQEEHIDSMDEKLAINEIATSLTPYEIQSGIPTEPLGEIKFHTSKEPPQLQITNEGLQIHQINHQQPNQQHIPNHLPQMKQDQKEQENDKKSSQSQSSSNGSYSDHCENQTPLKQSIQCMKTLQEGDDTQREEEEKQSISMILQIHNHMNESLPQKPSEQIYLQTQSHPYNREQKQIDDSNESFGIDESEDDQKSSKPTCLLPNHSTHY